MVALLPSVINSIFLVATNIENIYNSLNFKYNNKVNPLSNIIFISSSSIYNMFNQNIIFIAL